MTTTALKLRSDLVISRQDGPDGSVFVIKDPVTERFFRFRAVEHFIAQQLDGATAPETVRQRVEERLGVGITPENLESFVSRLQRIGLLTDANTAKPAAPRRRRWGGDVFYMRFRLFDPDRYFDWLKPRIRFLFTPQFVTLSATLILCALGVTTMYWGAMMAQLKGMFRFESLVLAWFTILGEVLLHECAHGLTCKHFGGRVREIGFLLIYFQPAFFCNISDAWLFPEKYKRLWVTFAGAYFEMFLWALATLTWWLTDPHTTVNHLALVVVATSAIKSFFNMNPLIKLDGYYLLSDWLGIPNLRQKAFAYLGSRFKRLWTTATTPYAEITPRERWIFPVYALLAGIYSYWLFGNILLWFGTYVIWRYQGVGFILFAVALGVLFRKSLKQWFLTPITLRAPFGRNGGDNLPRPDPPPPRKVPALLKLALLVAILLVPAFFCRMELKVAGPFTVMPLEKADVRAEAAGIIEQIYADEGDTVKPGLPLARLSDRDYQADLRKILAEIEAKQALLKLLKTGPRQEEVQLANTLASKANARIAFAESRVAMDQLLVDDKLVSRRDYEESLEGLALRQKEFQEASNRLALVLAGARPEEIEATEADVRRLRAQQQYLQDQVKLLTVCCPIAGVITTHKLKEKVGSYVNKGDLIAAVHELQTITVEIVVPEKEIADVQVGQKIVLKARAYPQRQFESKVLAIAPIVSTNDDPVYGHTVLVTAQVDNAEGLLKSEMTGYAKIHCGEQQVIDLITRRLVRYFRVEFWSWW